VNRAVYIRRCHICDRISESVGQSVVRCAGCSKNFAPYFYFDERGVPVLTDNMQRPLRLPHELHPVVGLSTWW
jgi:hypothetical protein